MNDTIAQPNLPPTEKEAIRQIDRGKSLRKLGIIAEIFKALGDSSFTAFQNILRTNSEKEILPAHLQYVLIVAPHKNKRAKAEGGKYRRKTLRKK